MPTSATIARLPGYMRAVAARAATQRFVSSSDLAADLGATPETVRRDLWSLGLHGTRGVGWDVEELTVAFSERLGVGSSQRLAIAGAGNIGAALAGYPNLAGEGFSVVAMFDVDPARVGLTLGGVAVRHASDMAAVCRAEGATLGVIATPASAAQQVADAFAQTEVAGLLNFAPVHLRTALPVRRVDVLRELHVLAFRAAEARK